MTPTQADKIMALADSYADAYGAWTSTRIERRDALRAALAEQPAEQDGLPLVVAGAIFDFAGYMTTRSRVIEVGSTANAGPVADLVKDWAKLRGLSLDDAAVLSWQEWLPIAPQPAKPAEQEPVGYWDGEFSKDGGATLYEVPQVSAFGRQYRNVPLYTAPQPTIPPGYKLVPVEPTGAMVSAVELTLMTAGNSLGRFAAFQAAYRAMLAAAPEAPQPAKRVPLTVEDIDSLLKRTLETLGWTMSAIEAAHGIKGETE